MSSITLNEGSAPPTPDTNKVVIYPKSDGFIYSKDDTGTETALSNVGSTDEKAKVSANDTTAGFLNGKLVAGTNVSFTENNDGSNETLTIAASFTDSDEKAKVSANDTTAGYLNGKLVAGSGITLTENNNGSNETLTIASSVAADTDPITTALMLEDWLTGNEDTDELGAYGWRIFNSGAGTIPTRIPGESGKPGILRLPSGTGATSRSAVSLGDTGLHRSVLGGGQIVFQAYVRVSATTAYGRINIGLGDSPGVVGGQVNCVCMGFIVGTDTTWKIEATNTSVATRVDTGITVVANTWYRLKFTVNTAGTSIQANINGSDVGTAVTTNIPTAAISPFFKIDGAAGGANANFDCDYILFKQTGLTR